VTITDSQRPVQRYDFQRRDAIEKSRLRLLQPILEVLTHRIARALTSLLQIPVKVDVATLEQHRWDEYVGSLPEPTLLTSATVMPTGGRIVLHLPLSLSNALVEIRLGGSGQGTAAERPLTEIEQRLVAEVALAVLDELQPALSPAMPVRLGATSTVSSSMYLSGTTPSDMVLLVMLNLEVNERVTQSASLCIPLLLLLALLDAIERLDQIEQVQEPGGASMLVRDRLLQTNIELSVRWPEIRLSPDELLSLLPGDVVRLGCGRDDPIVLSVGGIDYCKVVPTSQNKFVACIVTQ